MEAFLLSLVCLAASPEPRCSGEDFGFVYESAYCIDHCLRGNAEPYEPQVGDIVMTTDDLLFWRFLFNISFAGHPHHSGIVFQHPDGYLALLEAGPHDSLWIECCGCPST
jgi:hypothetical protein